MATDPPAVIETRVVHDTHRRATSLLADAAGSSSADVVTALRDFVVAMLRHHHESEDRDLWPLLTEAEPSLVEPLTELSREHERLDPALDRLAADADPATAAAVRDLVHEHLSHEEPVLLPALRRNISDVEWAGFSQRTVAGAPPVGTPLLAGLFHEVASDGAVELVLRHLPPEALELIPALRAEGEATLAELRGATR
jgi:hypothetical protein